jgi:hypothetical protein
MQAFEIGLWRSLVEEARGIADLARSPSHDDNLNTWRDVGVERTSILFERSEGGLVLRGWLSPGHPLCAKCSGPLSVEVMSEGGTLRATCTRCRDAIDYAAPRQAADSALRGTLALEHRADRPALRVEGEGGQAIALKCPSCGAELPRPAGSAPGGASSRLIECKFCPTISVVAQRSLHAVGAVAAEPEAWWLVFAGASPQRQRVEALAAERDFRKRGRKPSGPIGVDGPITSSSNASGVIIAVVICVVLAIALIVAFSVQR